MVDVEGQEYLDYIGSWGAMILGHAHPEITQALHKAVDAGTSYGAPVETEVELAEEIIRRVPSIEKVRLVNSGTEATMSAIRLARAATNREVIIKFAGGYHGHADSFLIQAGSGAATFSLPDSPGVTRGAAKDTRIAQFNDLSSVQQIFDQEGQSIAAVILEPVAGNMGVVPPVEGFLPGLRALCNRYGALLIFDEVMTGFRVAPGGAQELYSVSPDLTTFGKIIGGGLPVGAYGGQRELMCLVAPEGPVYQAGTLSGNPLAMTAGLTTLRLLTNDVYKKLEMRSCALHEGIVELSKMLGMESIVQRVGSMLTLFFTAKPVLNFTDAAGCDHEKFRAFFNSMLNKGVHLPPSGYEAWFLSLSHDESVIERTLTVIAEAFREIA